MLSLTISLKSFDLQSKKVAVAKILEFLSFLGFKETHLLHFPQKVKKITILKSPHIDKKSREQFQIKKNKTLIRVEGCSMETSLVLLDIMKKTFLIGVEIEIQIVYSKYFSRNILNTQFVF